MQKPLTQSVKIIKEGENIYMNVTVSNPSTNTQEIPFSVNQVLQRPILDNPSDYNLILTRFRVPGRNIPLVRVVTQGYDPVINPSGDVNMLIYTIAISYHGNNGPPIHLEYIPQTFVPPFYATFGPPPAVSNQDPSDPYYDVGSYQAMATMVTVALRAAIAAYNVAFPGDLLPVGTDAYMTFDPPTGLYSIVGTAGMASSSDPTDPNNVGIWFSTQLQNLFTSFEAIHNGYNLASGLDELILIQDNGNNAVLDPSVGPPNPPVVIGYKMTEEYDADANMEALTRIICKSTGLGGIVQQSEVNNLNSFQYQQVIFDFVPSASTQTGSYQGFVEYFAQSEFLRRQLTGRTPLGSIDMSFYYIGADGVTQRSINLQPGDPATLQLIFEKKC
jgi:hypothetical protein